MLPDEEEPGEKGVGQGGHLELVGRLPLQLCRACRVDQFSAVPRIVIA